MLSEVTSLSFAHPFRPSTW